VKAVVAYGAGDLRVDELPDPIPQAGEVLIAMDWGGVCGSDVAYWRNGASGTSVLQHLLVLGHEMAGRIARTGPGVRGFDVGHPVTVRPRHNGRRRQFCRARRGDPLRADCHLCGNVYRVGRSGARLRAGGAAAAAARVGSRIACHLAIPLPAAMQVVSRDVIEGLSQTRVIFQNLVAATPLRREVLDDVLRVPSCDSRA
jgi:threonine dehydrogenase-like Zn-dependent dehydrogenase